MKSRMRANSATHHNMGKISYERVDPVPLSERPPITAGTPSFKTPPVVLGIAVSVLCALVVFVTFGGWSVAFWPLLAHGPGTAHPAHVVEVQVPDDDFAWFFKSNRDEMSDVPIYFSKALPSWLKGVFVQNTLGIFENGDRSFLHAFDAFGKMVSWKFFGNGSAVFSTRFLESNFYNDSMKDDTIAPYLLFETVSPPFDLYNRMKSFIRGMDNMNVNVYEFTNPQTREKEYAAISDAWNMYQISIFKLSTKSRVTPTVGNGAESFDSFQSPHRYGDFGFFGLLSSAHPLPEYGKNSHLTFLSSLAYLPWESNKITLMRMTSLGRREVIVEMPIGRIPYIHSFAVTQTRVVLLASPYFIKLTCMVTRADPLACLDWRQDEPSTLFVINLENKTVDRMQVPNVFFMHHINAYDDPNGNVVMHFAGYDSPETVLNIFQLDFMRNPAKRNEFVVAKMKSIAINVAAKTAVMTNVDQRPHPGIASTLDMPVINEAYRSQHYCYVYGLALKIDNKTMSKTAIVKKDLCHNGKGDRVWYVPRQVPLEPWFVARPGAVEEDDGTLLVPVFHEADHTSHLVMLDAKDLTQINTAKMPTRMPYSTHGRFFPV